MKTLPKMDSEKSKVIQGVDDAPETIAKEGVSGPGRPLPYVEELDTVFPGVDLSSISGHLDAHARQAAAQLGAEAYTVGDAVAFVRSPSPSLVAHEVTHVVQQRSGWRDPSAVGRKGDRFEVAASECAAQVDDGTTHQSDKDSQPGGTVPGVQLRQTGEFEQATEEGPEIVRVENGLKIVGTSRKDETVQEFARRLWEHYIRIRFGELSPQLRHEMLEFVMKEFTPFYEDPQDKLKQGTRSYVAIDEAGEKQLAERFGYKIATEATDRSRESDAGTKGARGRDEDEQQGTTDSEFLADIRDIVKQMNLLYNLSFFVKGMTMGVRGNVPEDTVRVLAEKLQWAQFYQLRYPVAWLTGLTAGVQEGVVGLAEIPASVKDAIEFAQWLMTEASPETAEMLGKHAGEKQAGKIEDFAALEGAKFAEALAKVVGQIAFEIILEVLLSKGAGAAAKGIGKVLKALPDDIAKKVEGLLPEGKSGISKIEGTKVKKSATTPESGNKGRGPEAASEEAGGQTAVGTKPDISDRFETSTVEKGNRIYETTKGELGVPGKVKTHRDRAAQRRVSEGMGEDAGHRIGNQFGAPGDESNLSLQNWKSNRFGTYKELEKMWSKKLKNGVKIRAKVIDITRKGESRPFMRKVKWKEVEKDGSIKRRELTFSNPHTEKSRKAQDIPSTTSGSTGDIIDLEKHR